MYVSHGNMQVWLSLVWCTRPFSLSDCDPSNGEDGNHSGHFTDGLINTMFSRRISITLLIFSASCYFFFTLQSHTNTEHLIHCYLSFLILHAASVSLSLSNTASISISALHCLCCFIYTITSGRKIPLSLPSFQREVGEQTRSCTTALLLPNAGGDSMSFSRALHLGGFLSSQGHSPLTAWFPNKANCQDRYCK